MCKRKGFTLIELLVVIAIIAVLIAILMPVLAHVRKQAKSAACLGNLRHWGIIIATYTNDYDGYFFPVMRWTGPLRNYYSNPEMLFCPMAIKKPIRPDTGEYMHGKYMIQVRKYYDAYEAWWEETVEGGSVYVHGSYGLNGWCSTDSPGGGADDDKKETWLWKTSNVKGTGNIPLALDNAAFQNLAPYDYPYPYGPPPTRGFPDEDSIDEMRRACIDRHNKAINVLFMDFSARRVGLKELWKLKWHRKFNTNNSWTIGGGVQPTNWPQWMRSFTDY